MTTRREIVKCGAGLAAIIAAGRAPAALVRSMLGARNATLSGGGVPLPYDAEVEYIESTGTQWIDTLFCATGGCIVEYRFIQYSAGDRYFSFGSHSPSNNSSNGFNRNQSGFYSSNSICFNKCSAYASFAIPWHNLTDFHTIKYDNRGYSRKGWLDGNLIADQNTSEILNPVNTIVWSYSQYFSQPIIGGKLAWAKIWDANGELVRDYQPVRFTNGLGQAEGALYDRANPTGGLFSNGLYPSTAANSPLTGSCIGPDK